MLAEPLDDDLERGEEYVKQSFSESPGFSTAVWRTTMVSLYVT